DGDQLVEQVLKLAIPVFESAFPRYQALFLFDNATSHSAYLKDTLRACTMNLCSVGEQAHLRPGINSSTGEIQAIVMPDGTLKAFQLVLQERQLWRSSKKNKQCLSGGTWCTRVLIAKESDFEALKRSLEEEVEWIHHLVHFLPKYYCELNFIEYYWGAAKYYTQKTCGYHIGALRKMVPESLNSIKPILIWKFLVCTEKMMRVYHEGIRYGIHNFKEKITKTYRSHRRVSDSQTIVVN
ncbi:hypothetical protein L873DRAFT_1699311, partial [Choiromyces venosus 120613-1]